MLHSACFKFYLAEVIYIELAMLQFSYIWPIMFNIMIMTKSLPHLYQIRMIY